MVATPLAISAAALSIATWTNSQPVPRDLSCALRAAIESRARSLTMLF